MRLKKCSLETDRSLKADISATKKVPVIRYSVQPRSMVSPLPVPGKDVRFCLSFHIYSCFDVYGFICELIVGRNIAFNLCCVVN